MPSRRRAGPTALREVRAALARLPQLEKVTVVLFSPWDLETYQRVLAELSAADPGGNV